MKIGGGELMSMMSAIDSAISLMSGTESLDIKIARDKMNKVASNSYNELGEIFYLKEDMRSEFRSIYESIIDSTIASMY
jgi:hypothetical protein